MVYMGTQTKNVLVLGAGGMAGHVIATYLREQGHTVTTLSAKNKLDSSTQLVDVTDKTAFESFLDENEYDVIVNAIGLLVKLSEERKDLASYINSYLPHQLEQKFKDTKTKIVHLSTDCVFSGLNGPYKENSLMDGELFYDRSKALGEIINDKDLTFRMSIIGPDMQENGIGLFNWFYSQQGIISGFKHAMWNGVTTIELSKAINQAIQDDLHGLYHLVPNENISKLDLLKLFKSTFDRDDIEVVSDNRTAPDKTLVNTRTDFKFIIPSYPVMIDEMKHWIDHHIELYSHYF